VVHIADSGAAMPEEWVPAPSTSTTPAYQLLTGEPLVM